MQSSPSSGNAGTPGIAEECSDVRGQAVDNPVDNKWMKKSIVRLLFVLRGNPIRKRKGP
jgi:hypothetical protein